MTSLRQQREQVEWGSSMSLITLFAATIAVAALVAEPGRVGQGPGEFRSPGELLPEGRTLVGFGREVVYLVRTDADDLQWLERYRR